MWRDCKIFCRFILSDVGLILHLTADYKNHIYNRHGFNFGSLFAYASVPEALEGRSLKVRIINISNNDPSRTSGTVIFYTSPKSLLYHQQSSNCKSHLIFKSANCQIFKSPFFHRIRVPLVVFDLTGIGFNVGILKMNLRMKFNDC